MSCIDESGFDIIRALTSDYGKEIANKWECKTAREDWEYEKYDGGKKCSPSQKVWASR